VVVGATGADFKFTVSHKPLRVTIDDDNLLAVVH
jgi:hypothetical protein